VDGYWDAFVALCDGKDSDLDLDLDLDSDLDLDLDTSCPTVQSPCAKVYDTVNAALDGELDGECRFLTTEAVAKRSKTVGVCAPRNPAVRAPKTSWESMFALLEKYKAGHGGNANPPLRHAPVAPDSAIVDRPSIVEVNVRWPRAEYAKLRKWVMAQRRAYSRDKRRRKCTHACTSSNGTAARAGIDAHAPARARARAHARTGAGACTGAGARRGTTDRLDADRVARLEALGFLWDTREATWRAKFALLQKYKAAHDGDANPITRLDTAEYPGLGHWVHMQRRAFRNKERIRRGEKVTSRCRIGAEQIASLEALGMWWEFPQTKWADNFALLEKYKAAHDGDANPPRRLHDAAYPGLGCWVDKRRHAYRNETRIRQGQVIQDHRRISPDRIARLEALGFRWHGRPNSGSPCPSPARPFLANGRAAVHGKRKAQGQRQGLGLGQGQGTGGGGVAKRARSVDASAAPEMTSCPTGPQIKSNRASR